MAERDTIFLLSPANLGGERAALILNGRSSFPLAEQVRTPEGAPLGEVFSFVSGLYFRGKLTYAEKFGRPPPGLAPALVISPCEGLRFPQERMTLERLRAWAEVDIDAASKRFTEPLIEHAEALARAVGTHCRFVLLGSVATDKYVRPLEKVLGDWLLFPPDFVGRGDMSRGAVLLRAAREGRELAYAPLQGARRNGPRAPGVAERRRPATTPAEVVIFVGLQGAGKTTFYKRRFAESHVLVSKDLLRNNRRPARRQAELIAQALRAGRSVVVDNTNATTADRAAVVEEARAQGARVIGYYFDCPVSDCLARNAGREGRAVVPRVGIFATAKRLVRPEPAEGFHELYVVRPGPDFAFEVQRV